MRITAFNIVYTLLTSVFVFASDAQADDIALKRFLEAKPPYTSATAADGYDALLEVSRAKGFKRLGYAHPVAKKWQKKIIEVMKDGAADSALIKDGYEDISVFQLIGLGRDWFRGNYQTSESNKKIEAEYQRLSKQTNKG